MKQEGGLSVCNECDGCAEISSAACLRDVADADGAEGDGSTVTCAQLHDVHMDSLFSNSGGTRRHLGRVDPDTFE